MKYKILIELEITAETEHEAIQLAGRYSAGERLDFAGRGPVSLKDVNAEIIPSTI